MEQFQEVERGYDLEVKIRCLGALSFESFVTITALAERE